MLQMISILNKCHSFQLSINERILNFLKNFHKSIKQKKKIYYTIWLFLLYFNQWLNNAALLSIRDIFQKH